MMYMRFYRVSYGGFGKFVPLSYTCDKKLRFLIHIWDLYKQKSKLFPCTSFHSIRKSVLISIFISETPSQSWGKLVRKSSTKQFIEFIQSKLKGYVKLPTLVDENCNIFVTNEKKLKPSRNIFQRILQCKYELLKASVCLFGLSTYNLSNLSVDLRDALSPLLVLRVLDFNVRWDSSGDTSKCAHSPFKPLTMLFTIYIMFDAVPFMWKEALVTPIPKSSKSLVLARFKCIYPLAKNRLFTKLKSRSDHRYFL